MNLILASHGDLSKGILNSTMMITGDLHKNVETFSLYPGENPLDYANDLKKRIMRTKDTWIIIADIQGGSVHTALLQLTALDNVIVFSGMNLNLVLGIMLDDYEDLSEDHLHTIVDEARAGITCKKQIEVQLEDEF
ncbi:PTS sugar transporter subunit IIA [Solobacterium moorei]|uniref:PTS sugar transporter subunit IIA n=1 Tax=Solobacterium moorei TaxID=102148 RepID=UPI0023F30C31|nr:PTS sugar transporter subunit IIA [Solobacterium moorei]